MNNLRSTLQCCCQLRSQFFAGSASLPGCSSTTSRTWSPSVSWLRTPPSCTWSRRWPRWSYCSMCPWSRWGPASPTHRPWWRWTAPKRSGWLWGVLCPWSSPCCWWGRRGWARPKFKFELIDHLISHPFVFINTGYNYVSRHNNISIQSLSINILLSS